jgi:hypothetical protein
VERRLLRKSCQGMMEERRKKRKGGIGKEGRRVSRRKRSGRVRMRGGRKGNVEEGGRG